VRGDSCAIATLQATAAAAPAVIHLALLIAISAASPVDLEE
jgi:hypothetical protein